MERKRLRLRQGPEPREDGKRRPGSDPEALKSAERPPEAAESGFRAEGPGRLHRTSIAELRSRKSTGRLTTMVLYGPLPVHAHRRFRLTKRFRNSGPALFAL